MTVAILSVATESVEDVGSASAKLAVGRADAGVDDVCTNARAGPVEGVDGIQWQIALVDAIEAPGRIALSGISRNDSIFFNILDSEILAQRSASSADISTAKPLSAC